MKKLLILLGLAKTPLPEKRERVTMTYTDDDEGFRHMMDANRDNGAVGFTTYHRNGTRTKTVIL